MAHRSMILFVRASNEATSCWPFVGAMVTGNQGCRIAPRATKILISVPCGKGNARKDSSESHHANLVLPPRCSPHLQHDHNTTPVPHMGTSPRKTKHVQHLELDEPNLATPEQNTALSGARTCWSGRLNVCPKICV